MDVQLVTLRSIVYGAVAHGAPFYELCREAGLVPADLNDAEKWVSWDQTFKIWDVAIKTTNDKMLGLHLGEGVNLTLLGVIGNLIQACQTLEEALIALSEYGNSVCSFINFDFQRKKEEAYLHIYINRVLHNKNPEAIRQSLEFNLAGVIKGLQAISGKRIHPISLQLDYVPEDLQEYQRIFQCPIKSGDAHTSLVFKSDDLSLPVLSADRSLFTFFEYTLSKKKQLIDTKRSFTDTVKQMLFIDFKGQCPSIEIAAAHVNMHVRAFQRRLSDENMVYRKLCSEVRKELALSLLSNSKFRVGEVAELLGYSDGNAFRKAFKGWTHVIPTKVRA